MFCIFFSFIRLWKKATDDGPIYWTHNIRLSHDSQYCLHILGCSSPMALRSLYLFWGLFSSKHCNVENICFNLVSFDYHIFHYRFGYIGDVTSTKERTAIIAILNALGFVMMPLADFCGGQIYKAGGFLPVYITSLVFVFLGLFYIWLIPESITKRSHMKSQDMKDQESLTEEEKQREETILRRAWRLFNETNKLLVETFRYVFRYWDSSNQLCLYC